MVYEGPIADHVHEWVLPPTGEGRSVYTGLCKHCPAVREWRSTVLPNPDGGSWTEVNEQAKRRRWANSGSWEDD